MATSLAVGEEGVGGHIPDPNLLAISVGWGLWVGTKWRAVGLGLCELVAFYGHFF